MTGRGIAMAGALFALATAFFLAINNIAQGFYYRAGGTVQSMVILRYGLYLAGCAVVFPMLAKPLTVQLRDLKGGLASGVLYACGTLSLLASFQFIAISLAILSLYTFPIMTVVIVSVIDRRSPGVAQIVCLLAAFVGLAVALDVGGADFDARGVGLASAAAVSFALTFLWNERNFAGVDAIVTTYQMSLTGFFVMVGFVGVLGMPAMPVPGEPGFVAMAVALATYLASFVFMFVAIERTGATPTAMIMNLEPVFTVAFGAVLLGEVFSGTRLLGAAVVLGSVLASQWFARRRAASRIGVGA